MAQAKAAKRARGALPEGTSGQIAARPSGRLIDGLVDLRAAVHAVEVGKPGADKALVRLCKGLGIDVASGGPAAALARLRGWMDAAAQAEAGAVTRHVPMVMLPDGKGGWRPEAMGCRGKAGVRVTDVWDRMADQGARAGGGVPFSRAQVDVARAYAALTERVAAGGIKLSSLDAVHGGDAKGDFMDAFAADCEALRRLHRRIGAGVSLSVRRVRPSERGSRWNIRDRALVDMVCLGGRTLSEVLQAHGWSVYDGSRRAARIALCGALDRMGD